MAYINKGNGVMISDTAWYAFNPCYIRFGNVTDIQEVTISIGDVSIKSYIVGRDAKVDISGLLQTLWAEEKWDDLDNVQTVKRPVVIIDTKDGTITISDHDVIWGSVNIAERYLAKNDKDGYYLRWIDNLGQVRYHLFDMGQAETKTKVTDTVEREVTRGDVSSSTSFDLGRTMEMTLKGSTMLDFDKYEEVLSIKRAIVVQMYLGRSEDKDVWVPVRVTASQETDREHPRMRELKVNIILPTYHSQTL